MYNKKTLSKATAELDKAKAPKKPKDIKVDPMGYWNPDNHGKPVRIPSNDITMQGVGYPVLGVANNGQRKIMLPGADYTFPGADYVDEYPQMKKGGTKKKRKTKSIMGTNKLMQKGPLFQDYSKRIYDPNVDYFQDGGEYIEADLTDDEIEEYRRGGYIVEDISVPELNQAQKGGQSKVILSKEHTDKKGNKTIVVTKDDGTKYIKVISKDGKVYNNTQAGLSPEMRVYGKKIAEWENRSSGAAQPVDEFWTLPIGMTSAGVKGTVGLAKGLGSLASNVGKSSLVQAGKTGTKALFKAAPKWAPGMNLGNAIGSGFAGSALTDVVTGKVAEPWKKANKSGKGSDYVDAVTENMFTALDAIPAYGAGSKGLKQLGKYATTQTPLKNTYKVLPEGTFKNYSKLKTKGNSYRVAGHDAHKDFIESGLLRSKTNLPENATFLDRVQARPTAFPSFQKDYADLRYLPENGGVVFETEIPTFKRGELNPVTGGKIKGRHYAHRAIDPKTGRTLTEIPASDVNVYEGSAHWLKGHKNINPKSKSSKAIAYKEELQNEYWPKSLTEHPDAEYVMQKTPVKDFGIRPNIKNLPTKQTHGYDINEKDVHQLINQNLEYLTHPNYIKRRQSVTGETPKQIKKDIDSYISNLKKSDIDLGLDIEYPGGHIRGDRKWFLGKKSKDVTGVNPNKVSSRTEALHVLDHEIGHALSPANQSTFKGMPKYKNYPNLKISKAIDKDGYLGSDYEQQVRFNRIKNYLHNKYGISKHEPITEKDFDLFANDYNKWVNEEHMVQGKGNMPRGMQDIGEMLTGHTQTAGQSAKTRRNIIAGINRSWALAPVGITGAALMNMPKPEKSKKMKKGGMVVELTPDEIQDYIKQGYIVEDVD